MTVWEGLCLCFVLLLALYGCAQATVRIVSRILRPRDPRVTLLLTLAEQDDQEQQIRFARWVSRENQIPLCADVSHLENDAQRIAAFLLNEKYK